MSNSLVKNSLFNVAYKVTSVLYPLVTIIYVSHVLMAEYVGIVSYAQNIASYFVIVAALGVPTYGVREVATRHDDKNALSKLFFELLILNALSTSVALFAYGLLITSIPRFQEQMTLYVVAGLQIAFNYFNVDWYYQGIEDYKYISLRSIAVKMIALLMLPFVVRTSADYINYALICCFAVGGNNLINIIHTRKYVSWPSCKIEIRKHLKPVLTLLTVSMAVEVYAMVDITMLGIFTDDSTVGCYSNAMKTTRTVITTVAAIGAVLFPRLSKVYNEKNREQFNYLINKGIKIMLMIAVPSAVGLVLLRNDLVLVLFGNSFAESSPLLAVLAIMIPVVVCNTLLGGQTLVAIGKESQYMISVVIASVLNLALNFILIPIFGAISAAFASLTSELVVLIFYCWFTKEYVQLNFDLHFFITMLIPIAAFVIASTFVVSPLIENTILRFVVNIGVCVLIYAAFGLALKNEAICFTWEIMKELLRKS